MINAVFYGKSILSDLLSNNSDFINLKCKIVDNDMKKTTVKPDEEAEILVFNFNVNIDELAFIATRSGWKSFRVGTLEISGENAENDKFYIIYRGDAVKLIDDYIFSKPFNKDEIASYLKEKSEKIKNNDLRAKLKKIFAKIGIYSNLLGYEYLIEAIIKVSLDKRLVNSLTTELYPSLAEKFSTSEKNIERNMRNSIEVSCNRGKFFEVANSLGGNFTPYEKPSNGEFIAFLTDIIAE